MSWNMSVLSLGTDTPARLGLLERMIAACSEVEPSPPNWHSIGANRLQLGEFFLVESCQCPFHFHVITRIALLAEGAERQESSKSWLELVGGLSDYHVMYVALSGASGRYMLGLQSGEGSAFVSLDDNSGTLDACGDLSLLSDRLGVSNVCDEILEDPEGLLLRAHAQESASLEALLNTPGRLMRAPSSSILYPADYRLS